MLRMSLSGRFGGRAQSESVRERTPQLQIPTLLASLTTHNCTLCARTAPPYSGVERKRICSVDRGSRPPRAPQAI